jgi:HSP20 family protein
MSQIFDDFGSPTHGSDETMSVWNWKPLVDIYDNDENIVITAELPGINKENIKVDVKDRVLTLKGERLSENEVKEDSYHRRERVYGKFERAFTLPVEVDPEEIQADYKDGILKINIPKPKEQKPKQVTIH